MKNSTQNFSRIVVLRNHRSTHIRFADKVITEIMALYPEVPLTTVEIGSTIAETHQRLRAQIGTLGPASLLCVAGGDGTVNRAVEFLLGEQSLPGDVRKTPILPLWAGNANDLAHMANGAGLRVRLPMLLRRGVAVPVYPLVCTLANKDGRRTYHAACYVSFGVTAAVAHELNQHGHRSRWWRSVPGSRFIGEAATTMRAFLGSDGFTIATSNGTYTLHERSYVNGSRMAKLQPLAASLTDKAFVCISIDKRDKHFSAVWHWLRGGMRPEPKQETGQTDAFVAKSALWMQVDGEPVKIPKGTRVSVGCSLAPLYVFSTKLARKS